MLTYGNHFVGKRNNYLLNSYDKYNPLNLPPNTVRVRTSDGNRPSGNYTTYESATLVQGTSDVYDVYKSGTDFSDLLWCSFNTIEVLGANTTGITNMHEMFANCWSLTSVALFDISNVTDMSRMFAYCKVLTKVPLFDTSSVTNMEYTFETCQSLTSIPLFDTSNVITMFGTFDGCWSLTSVPLFNTSKLERMDMMFMNCISLTSVPLFNTVNVKHMVNAFNNCSSLTSIPLFNTSKVTWMFRMFYNCYKVESGALALYQQASSQATPPTDHTQTFYNCGRDTTTGAAELEQIPSDWK